MEFEIKSDLGASPSIPGFPPSNESSTPTKSKGKGKDKESQAANKRRCVSTACIACRRRKSKCDGNLPKCAACASVYLTECEYAPHTDHRRKGVYKKDADSVKTKNSTLQTLIQAILNYDEDDALDLVRQIRVCDNLEDLAQSVEAKEKGLEPEMEDSPVYQDDFTEIPQFDAELSGKMGDLLVDGSVKFIGGTSNLIWLNEPDLVGSASPSSTTRSIIKPREEAIISWTNVTKDKDLILHFINMYFCWHYSYFTTLSKELFYRDFLTGSKSQNCSALLVNAMLALGCHFSSRPDARANPEDSSTTGDHFFAEAKRIIYEDDEFENAKLCTVQALALMSVREAGCGRESKGWVYSGMSFRMASDLGLNIDAPPMNELSRLSDEDIDARRMTFWGCFLFDKTWSNYLGREPQLLSGQTNVRKFDVFPSEDSEMWSPYTDAGIVNANAQPARTRAVALQIVKLAEISSDLLVSFYHPSLLEKPLGKQAELKKLSDIHTRLETWKRELPVEMEPKDGQLPQVLLMHMFYQLLYIHLYRPFLKYTKSTSPLPGHVSPRKFCTQAAGAISKLLRLYKRTHGLRQIINKVVYIAHSACTIHLLNLPDKNAKRDIVHGVKQLEEIGECWTCARRTLKILFLCAEKWKIDLPDEALATFARMRVRWGSSEFSVPAVSPGTIAQIHQQLNSRPVPEQMAVNLQARIQQVKPNERPFNMGLVQVQSGLSTTQTTSPSADMTETRRSSGTLSLPPHSAAELTRSAGRIRPSTQLTKAQQDAWNAHQARMAGHATQNSSRPTSTDGNADAAQLFGGIDTLIEQSQDWWFNDQNQLAAGFENWNAPTPDWSALNNPNMTYTEMSNASSGATSMIFGGNNLQMSYGDGANDYMRQMNGVQMGGVEKSTNVSRMKRHLPFDDDEMFN